MKAGMLLTEGVTMTATMLMLRTIACRVSAKSEKVLTFRGTTESVASDGGVLIADGVDFSRFEKNPMVQWDHGMRSEIPVVGRAVDWRYDATARAWDFDVEFASDESDLAARVYRLAKAGFMPAVSVGFQVTERDDNPPEEERRKYDLPRWGWIGRKWQLHELSMTVVGADPAALKRAEKLGAVLSGDAGILIPATAPMTRADAGALTGALDRLVIAVESLHTLLDQPEDNLETPGKTPATEDGDAAAKDVKAAAPGDEEEEGDPAADPAAETDKPAGDKPAEDEESEETGGGAKPKIPSAEDDEEEKDRALIAAIDALRDRVSQKRGATNVGRDSHSA